MYFTSKSDIKDAITSYAVQNGRDLKLIKNDKKRVRWDVRMAVTGSSIVPGYQMRILCK